MGGEGGSPISPQPPPSSWSPCCTALCVEGHPPSPPQPSDGSTRDSDPRTPRAPRGGRGYAERSWKRSCDRARAIGGRCCWAGPEREGRYKRGRGYNANRK